MESVITVIIELKKDMKKLLSLISLILLCSPYSARADMAPEPDPFTDVSYDTVTAQIFNAVVYLKEEGIVNGYSDGTFRPNELINRAEFSKIVSIATGSETDAGDGSGIFTDVNNSDWFNPYIQNLHSRGIISGYADGSFKPAENINWAEAAKIVVKAHDLSVEESTDKEWYEPYTQVLEELGIKPDSVASPDQLLTRGEMAEIIGHKYP